MTSGGQTSSIQLLLTSGSENDDVLQQEGGDPIRDIHALSPPNPSPPPTNPGRRRDPSWSSQSTALSEGGSSEIFTSMSREFNALVIAGSAIDGGAAEGDGGGNNLERIGEEEETNPLAIVPDRSMDPDPGRGGAGGGTTSSRGGDVAAMAGAGAASVQRVKKEEVEAKITAWQTAKIAKINNRFKRDDAVINGWESERVQKATCWMKKVERKLEEKRAKAMEKMQNRVAKAHRKAEERRATAEAKRGTKVARVLEVANLMRAVGRPPVKRSFF